MVSFFNLENFKSGEKLMEYFLTLRSEYVKLDTYLLQFLCHVTCEVKFLDMIFVLFTLFLIIIY